jgi:hypothetical protein
MPPIQTNIYKVTHRMPPRQRNRYMQHTGCCTLNNRYKVAHEMLKTENKLLHHRHIDCYTHL